MKLARASAAALALAVVLSLAPTVPARAGDPSPTAAGPLTVLVRGHATVPADKLEIEFTVSASAEEPNEAERLYEERLAKVVAAAKAAPGESGKSRKVKEDEKPAAKKPAASDDDDDEAAPPKKKGGKKDEEKPTEAKDPKDGKDAADTGSIAVEVSERGLSVQARGGKSDENPLQKMMAMQMGGAQAKTEPPVHFSSKVIATIKGVSKLERKALLKRIAQLLDKACDAGADGCDTASAPVVRFLSSSGEDARSAAYEDAVGKAKARAKTLAGLVDRKVARVASVREAFVPAVAAQDQQAAAANVMVQMYGIKAGEGPAAASTFELSADVDLEVTFELAP